jgi:alcohol dehydrogenase class IV
VLFGAGRRREAADALKRLGCRRALVLSTPGHRFLAEQMADSIGELAAGVHDGATMHTPVAVTERALAVFRDLSCDAVVAIGGGSTIGLSKAIALRTDAPQVVLPTTYAGSEVTTMLGETRDGVKTTQRTLRVLPETVIYDVELTLTLPAPVSATSGMNAIAHAVEAMYARDGNPVVSLLAEQGIAALARALPRIVANLEDLDARSDAQYGAWLCGTCMARTTMGLHHKLCHVLGGAFDLPHAATHAVLLPYAVAYNRRAAPEAMRRIAQALGSRDAADGLHALGNTLGVPRSLRSIGMPASGLDRAVDLALRDAYANPRPLERQAMRDLLARALDGAAPAAD